MLTASGSSRSVPTSESVFVVTMTLTGLLAAITAETISPPHGTENKVVTQPAVVQACKTS